MPINPNLGYSQLMAQMIAQARTPQAPGQARRGGGGGGGAPIQGTSTTAQGNISLGPWLRLFGGKTPEEKEKLVSDLATALEDRSEEDRETLLQEPSSQTVIQTLDKTGAPIAKYGFTKIRETTLGQPVYGYTPTRAEKLGPEKRAEISGYGPGPAGGIEQQRIQMAGTETGILKQGGEVARTFIENKAALKRKEAEASETEGDKKIKTAQAESLTAQAALHGIQEKTEKKKLEVEYAPEAIQAERQRKAAETKYYGSKAFEAEATGKYHLSLVGKEANKRDLEMYKQDLQIYKQGQMAFINVATGLKPGEKDAALKQLTAITSSRIYSTGSSLGDTAPANDAMSFWLDSTMPEVLVDVPSQGRGWGGVGAVVGMTRPNPEIETKMQRYAKDAKDLTEAMGLGLDVRLARKTLSLVTEVVEKTTLTQTTVGLAAWAVQYFGAPQLLQADPTMRQDVERLKKLLTPRPTGAPTGALPGRESTPSEFGGPVSD